MDSCIGLPARWFFDSVAIDKVLYHVRVGTETFPELGINDNASDLVDLV